MKKIKILTVVGARPQFIKAATINRITKKNNLINEVIVHTGQHFDHNMNEIFFKEMDITPPKYNLQIHSLNHGAMTARMIEELEKVFIIEKPDCVLLFGDTNSTLAGALAARKLHIKIAHIEAGLRSFNTKMPEEINRIITDRISDYLFCPTKKSVDNLLAEGFGGFESKIYNVGDVMFDAVKYYSSFLKNKPSIREKLKLPSEYILCTLHREENINSTERLFGIVKSLNSINKNIKIVMTAHPRFKKTFEKHGLNAGFIVIDSVGYFDMMELLQHAKLIMTDSGGLQKEAYYFDKPCVTLRDETEWVELVDIGMNFVAGATMEQIQFGFDNMVNRKKAKYDTNIYGDGSAAEKIINILIRELNKK